MPSVIRTFRVKPQLPAELEPLLELANNLAWAWNHETRDLFGRIDRELWSSTNHNPVMLLGRTPDARLQELAVNDSFLAHMQRCVEALQQYREGASWFKRHFPQQVDSLIAYFSMEFGIVESLTIYSGGLGILAGDFLKSSSDLGVPLIGIGLLYQEGYLSQYLNVDGWQQERYPCADFYNLPLRPVRDDNGNWLLVEVPYPDHTVVARILEVQVGRTRLLLLDSNLEENSPEDRNITRRLYGGDRENRIRQEILLGIGGVKALKAMKLEPALYHMNEGHSAFLAIERSRQLMSQAGLSLQEAQVLIRNTTLFTTHTPVPAGIDEFPVELVKRYADSLSNQLGLGFEEFLALGQLGTATVETPFNMAYFAMNFAAYINGVSQLHGEVARSMWSHRWPAVPEAEIPIDAVTNGIHISTWVSREMVGLFNRYLGPNWESRTSDPSVWDKVESIPHAELWRVHENLRSNLISFSRRRLAQQLADKGATSLQITAAAEVLDPAVLTIGFARRFATYKRADLLLRHPERLLQLLNNTERPLQFIFAGKAHPRDESGKELIRDLIRFIKQHDLQGKMVFLEDYDMNMARTLVQGVDVWLNTPRRPLEASGTSGMKVLPNGGLNLSVLDGWWVEGYSAETGWAIGRDEVYAEPELQDEMDANSIYDLLEHGIIPLFYQRDGHDVPREWVERMKNSLRKLCPFFNTDRMLQEYNEKFYQPCFRGAERFSADNWAVTREFSSWRQQLEQNWPGVLIGKVETSQMEDLTIGSQLEVTCQVELGVLRSQDVTVQLYYGQVDTIGQLPAGSTIDMTLVEEGSPTNWRGLLPCSTSGRYGFNVRVIPSHPDLQHPLCPGLVVWGKV